MGSLSRSGRRTRAAHVRTEAPSEQSSVRARSRPEMAAISRAKVTEHRGDRFSNRGAATVSARRWQHCCRCSRRAGMAVSSSLTSEPGTPSMIDSTSSFRRAKSLQRPSTATLSSIGHQAAGAVRPSASDTAGGMRRVDLGWGIRRRCDKPARDFPRGHLWNSPVRSGYQLAQFTNGLRPAALRNSGLWHHRRHRRAGSFVRRA